MFEQGVPSDQFHQFIASNSTTTTTTSSSSPSLLIPIPSLHQQHGNSFSNIHAFNNFYNTTTTSLQQVPSFLQQNCNSVTASKINSAEDKVHGEDDHGSIGAVMNLQMGRERSFDDPWTGEEIYALLKTRSNLENWFPDFTWDHVSRKLEELGFKRSAEKCKEKYEEESCKYFNNNNNNINYTKFNNYRDFGDLDELYNNHEEHQHHQEAQEVQVNNISKTDNLLPSEPEEERGGGSKNIVHQNFEETSAVDHGHHHRIVDNPIDEDNYHQDKVNKKRKREGKFEKFKGFCEDVVREIVAKQEEIHNKLIEDMVKREEEKIAREDAWKKQEIERINKELEMRSHEQTLAGDRQAKIIQFLNKFTPSSSTSTSTNSSLPLSHINMKPSSQLSSPKSTLQNPNSTQNPSSLNTTIQETPITPPITQLSRNNVMNPRTTSNERDEIGKRWPKDEVLALINIKCNTNNSEEKLEGAATKGIPLWERISQGMMELGYKRSAKRCKEKWENINKYFRKTRDLNKKRSIDSRTCPYFHQLSSLYRNQGTVLDNQSCSLPSNNGSGIGSDSRVQEAGNDDGDNQALEKKN